MVQRSRVVDAEVERRPKLVAVLHSKVLSSMAQWLRGHTGTDLLTGKQRQRLEDLFATDTHVEVEASWGVYQGMIAAYREPDRVQGKKLMQAVIIPSAQEFRQR